MRTRIAIILAIVFGLLLVASCSSPKGPTVNRLMVEDGWIFYSDDNVIYYGEYSGAAYKVDFDGNNKTRIE
ncbi:hypothetical protein J0B03_11870 [Alkalibacter rhizosphaerae]|uniref:Uncharacterized protein n=1 Tax=Alkalibacter rhizosphaerae TaxID=2815577 RepID=A0A975AHC2_9FIRM|nr:hypothetical protein [Alkalibacter rhizosphaerae]QSX08464.1 hypothetical protein J0B03_11870 [Alkalibacter rhizosphaerae]